MKCTNCGAEFEDGTLFCPVCGTEVQWVPEYNTLETLIRQKEIQDQEKKRKEAEARKEKERLERKAEQERKRKKKKTLIAAGSVAAIAAVCAGGLFSVYQKQRNSFDFQLAQAETEFSNKDYENALKYVDRALSLKPDSAEAKILEAKIFLKEENEDAALKLLLSVIKTNPDSTSAYGEVLRLYKKNEKYDEIKKIMDEAADEMRATYKDYICELPEPSVAKGIYLEETEVSFLNVPQNGEIYYTLDGTEPSRKSTKYEDAIELDEEGDYTLKYIAYNEKSIPSDIGEVKYTISFEDPDSPKISPSSGKYERKTTIIVSAKEGCTIYYAFDEEPTIESREYTEPVTMPEGEHTFQAIAVDERGKVSDIASRVYVFYGE